MKRWRRSYARVGTCRRKRGRRDAHTATTLSRKLLTKFRRCKFRFAIKETTTRSWSTARTTGPQIISWNTARIIVLISHHWRNGLLRFAVVIYFWWRNIPKLIVIGWSLIWLVSAKTIPSKTRLAFLKLIHWSAAFWIPQR